MLEDPLLFLLIVLATYRLAILLAWENGPAQIFLKLRMRLGAYNYGSDGQPDTSLGELAGCPYCQGIYIALVFAIIFYPLGLNTLLYWLAIAGGQALLTYVSEEK